MDWLSQNWAWVLVAVGLGFFVFRDRFGGRAGDSDHAGHVPGDGAAAVTDVPEAAIDPVGGEAVRTGEALTSLHEGTVYYFASKENRERFETAPQQYAKSVVGHPVRTTSAARPAARGRRGCC